MGSRALLLVKDVKYTYGHCMPILQSILLVKDVYFTTQNQFLSNSEFLKVLHHYPNNICFPRNCSTTTTSGSSMESLDVPRLAETAQIFLTPQEVEEFAPKVGQVMEWFGQLQAVDLESLEPSIKEDTEGDNFRADISETFENWEAIIAAIPNYEEPFIKVPKVLNKE